jgi:multidrug efflux pump subunit AcrB
MWIVKVALRAPYTFTVIALLLMIGGVLSVLQMPKDIFPAINIPVVGLRLADFGEL